jgi:hypothetical protein
MHDVQQPPPFQAPNNIFRYTTEELRSVAAHYATINKVATLRSTPSRGKEVLSDIAIHDAEEVAKGGKKRHKQHPQWATTAVSHDGGNDEKAGRSDVGRVVTTTHSGKRQARPLTDHFKRLLEEACHNHMYPIKHKLKDCDMMKNFMISGSLTRAMELDEVPDGSNTMPFPRENAVMMIYDGCSPLGRCRMSNLSPATLTCRDQGHEDVKSQVFQYICVCVCVCMLICIIHLLQKEKKK